MIPNGFNLDGLDNETKQHAEHLWKYLEDLSKNDPEGYKKFIADQKKEAAEEKKRREGLYIPEKCFCVATQRMDKDKSKYHFINFCTSTEVPVCQDQMGNPADSSVPIGKLVIPFSIGIWRDDTHKEKPCRAVDVVYHPKTVDRANQDPYFRMQIIELAFKHIEEDHSCKLHRRYKELKKMKYKGEQAPPQRNETGIATQERMAEMKKEFRESMLAKQKGEIVLPFQSKLTENNQHLKTKESRHVKPNNSSSSNNDNSKGAKKASRETGGGSSDNGEGEFKLKLRPETGLMGKGKKNKPLIEICEPSASTPASTVTAQSSSPLAAAPITTAKKTALSASSSPTILMSDPSSTPALSLSSSKPVLKTPEYSIKCDASTVTLAIKLPLLESVSQVDLDISHQQVILQTNTEGAHLHNYQLSVTLPFAVDADRSAARFNSKKKKLKLACPLLKK